MSPRPQTHTYQPTLFADPSAPIIVDNFAGGGGASLGIEAAMGRTVDIAINHDPAAIRMHQVNHPETEHYCENVWDIDPAKAVRGRPVELAWFSPDCRHFSRAKGAKPDRSVKIRGLAWVVLRWAAITKPNVIMLENVVEFQQWGPLTRTHRPNKELKGRTFDKWVSQLEGLGYHVEHKNLTACDYGAPTSRTRFFLIARRDGGPIVWPAETHDREAYKSAASIIDWSVPMASIFERKRPLAEKTMARIAAGVDRFVFGSKGEDPFVIKGQVPFGVPRYGERPTQAPRTIDLSRPLPTIVSTGNQASLCAAYLARHWGGMTGLDIRKPFPTVTQKGCQDQLAVCHLGTARAPEVRAFLSRYNGRGIGQSLREPLGTVTSKDRYGLVSVKGEHYEVSDIGMRMMKPRELYNAQGFSHGYVIDRDLDGRTFTQQEQLRMCGNSVPPCLAEALVRANVSTSIEQEQAA